MILIALSLFSLSLVAGCTKKGNANGNQSQNQQTATGEISLSVVSANMIFGDELNIICFYGGDKPVEWKSSDETVALVDDDGSVSTAFITLILSSALSSRGYVLPDGSLRRTTRFLPDATFERCDCRIYIGVKDIISVFDKIAFAEL